jgi:hypothetical protein
MMKRGCGWRVEGMVARRGGGGGIKMEEEEFEGGRRNVKGRASSAAMVD